MITSRQNSLIKEIRSLSDKKNRDALGVYVAEGTKLVNDAIFCQAKVEKVICTEKALPCIKSGNIETVTVSEDVFASLSGEVSPQGAIAIIKKPDVEFSQAKGNALFLDGVSDPSNVGAILRTAAASGYNDVYLTDDCADPFGNKAVRASMGGVFRVNLHVSKREKIANDLSLPLVTADMKGEDVFTFKPDGNFCLVIGNEGKGINEVIRKKSKYSVSIPMQNDMESLNASVSAGILMYILKTR